MKKGIIVLLITVLAAGMAFAGLTGSAAINLGYNLDDSTYGFKNIEGVKYSFTFTFDTASTEKSEHQTDIWAEIAAEASAVYEFSTGSSEVPSNGDGAVDPDFASLVAFNITKANIHVNDITIGILNAGGAYNYAADYHKKSNGAPENNKVSTSVSSVPGFTVSYDGYGAGFGFSGNAKNETYGVLAHIQTKSFDLAEGLTTQAAAHAYVANDAKQFYFAAKAAYAADKLSADAAGEIAVKDSKVDVEAAANAKYDFVYANLYFYTLAADRDADVKPYFDAKIGAGYTFEGDVEVKVNGYVDAVNVIADAREITVGADATATVAPVSFYLNASYAIYAKKVGLTAKVTYTHDVFTAYAQLKSAIAIGADPALTKLAPEVSVSTSKIVENATLALTWKGAEFAEGAAQKANGAITASAKIAF